MNNWLYFDQNISTTPVVGIGIPVIDNNIFLILAFVIIGVFILLSLINFYSNNSKTEEESEEEETEEEENTDEEKEICYVCGKEIGTNAGQCECECDECGNICHEDCTKVFENADIGLCDKCLGVKEKIVYKEKIVEKPVYIKQGESKSIGEESIEDFEKRMMR